MPTTYDYNANIRAPDLLQVDGYYIEDLIPGYRQLYIKGRTIIGQSISVVDVPYRDGTFLENTHDKPNELEIGFAIKFRYRTELRAAIGKLNDILRGNRLDRRLTIRFKDSLEFYNYGYLLDGDTNEDTREVYTGTFKLYFPTSIEKKNKQTAVDRVTLTHADHVLPLKLKGTVASNTDIIGFTCRNAKIEFKGHYSTGKTLLIEWLPDEIRATYDNRNCLHELKLLSIPEEFWLRKNDTVRGINITVNQIEWEDERR